MTTVKRCSGCRRPIVRDSDHLGGCENRGDSRGRRGPWNVDQPAFGYTSPHAEWRERMRREGKPNLAALADDQIDALSAAAYGQAIARNLYQSGRAMPGADPAEGCYVDRYLAGGGGIDSDAHRLADTMERAGLIVQHREEGRYPRAVFTAAALDLWPDLGVPVRCTDGRTHAWESVVGGSRCRKCWIERQPRGAQGDSARPA